MSGDLSPGNNILYLPKQHRIKHADISSLSRCHCPLRVMLTLALSRARNTNRKRKRTLFWILILTDVSGKYEKQADRTPGNWDPARTVLKARHRVPNTQANPQP